MRFLAKFGLMLTVPIGASLHSNATEIRAMTGADFLGEGRLLVACNSNWTEDRVDWPAFQDRDILLFEQFGDRTYDIRSGSFDKIDRYWLDRSKVFQNLIECRDETEFVLIGKDRTVKKRWQNSLPLSELFQTIDAMPMRQYELKIRDAN